MTWRMQRTIDGVQRRRAGRALLDDRVRDLAEGRRTQSMRATSRGSRRPIRRGPGHLRCSTPSRWMTPRTTDQAEARIEVRQPIHRETVLRVVGVQEVEGVVELYLVSGPRWVSGISSSHVITSLAFDRLCASRRVTSNHLTVQKTGYSEGREDMASSSSSPPCSSRSWPCLRRGLLAFARTLAGAPRRPPPLNPTRDVASVATGGIPASHEQLTTRCWSP